MAPASLAPNPYGTGGDSQAALRGHLFDLGFTAEDVRASLAAAGYSGPDPERNLIAYLTDLGWREVGLEPLGDTGWLCVTAATPAGDKVATDLPEPVEEFFDRTDPARPSGAAVYCMK